MIIYQDQYLPIMQINLHLLFKWFTIFQSLDPVYTLKNYGEPQTALIYVGCINSYLLY